MKLVMTLLVRDEIDILDANLRFHLDRGVDFIIATDNLSLDGSTELLRDYERRGLLRYIAQPDDDYAQARWVTHMARLAACEHAADWVINADADEFWYPHQGDLKQMLALTPPASVAACVPRINFPPLNEAGYFADVMTLRERHSRGDFAGTLAPKVCHRAIPDIAVLFGNHAVERGGQPLAAALIPISILHFPLRSYPQFANKIAKGGAAGARGTPRRIAVMDRWAALYQLWLADGLHRHYQAQVLHPPAIAEGLSTGRLLRDTRLCVALAALRAPVVAVCA